MRRNTKAFSIEEYMFLHKTFLNNLEETKIFKKIKAKKGLGLDKTEIKHIKRKFAKWKTSNGLMPLTLSLTNPNI